MNFEPLPVAIRIHQQPDSKRKKYRRPPKTSTLPRRTLVIDCETTTDPTQRLRFGVWQLYIDDHSATAATFCHQEGIFYADDLPDRDPDGFAALQDYVHKHQARTSDGTNRRIPLISRSQFVDGVFWRWAGPSQQATVVGYNLPFDLTRVATHAARARRRFRGGTSLRLWDYEGGDNSFRPRIVIQTIDSYRALIQYTAAKDEPQYYRGRFLDLRTLCFALTDKRGMTLEKACTEFGVEYTKDAVTHGAPINSAYITYCRDDVFATVRLFRAAMAEFNQHPIDLEPHYAYSSATIGKHYLKALGIEPFTDREVFIDPELAGWGMAAFYGGRSECRIRRLEVPVVYCDFTSMYPTVNTLMRSWQLIIANQIHPIDNTTEVRALLDAPDLIERLHDRELWPILNTLVEIEPDGATLPVRARYDNQTWGIGVNPYTTERACWYSLADVLATRVYGGPTPTIVRAFRLTPTEPLITLANASLRRTVEVNPKTHDLYAHIVEQRHRHRHGKQKGTSVVQLGAFLKTLVNALSYGTLVEYQPRLEGSAVLTTLHTDRTAIPIATERPETPGEYCAPPIAACVTGAARLLLALAEHHVTELGGTYAFCDTDSIAIVATEHGDDLIACPGGTHTTPDGQPAVRALSWAQVDEIIQRLEPLHPYNREHVTGTLLKIEDENRGADGTRRELRCYAISAKRYQLTTADGTPIKDSEHGLGHLLNPTGNPGWIRAAWHHLRHPELPEPDWFDLPAISRFTLAGPELLEWFRHLNHNKPYPDQIKPGNFLLIAHLDPLDATRANPIALYDPSPGHWADLEWIDRNTGHPIEITTRPADGYDRPNTARVRTYRDILTAYHRHPETKALAPDGQPVRHDTTGLLQRRPVHALPRITYIGKEAHDLEHRAVGLVPDPVNEYNIDPDDDWHTLTVPTLRTLRIRDITNSTRVHPRTIQRALQTSNASVPHAEARQALTNHAVDIARTATGASRVVDPASILYHYLHEQK